MIRNYGHRLSFPHFNSKNMAVKDRFYQIFNLIKTTNDANDWVAASPILKTDKFNKRIDSFNSKVIDCFLVKKEPADKNEPAGKKVIADKKVPADKESPTK